MTGREFTQSNEDFSRVALDSTRFEDGFDAHANSGGVQNRSFEEQHTDWPVQECLAYIVSQRLQGKLTVEPAGTIYHFRAGRLEAVERGRPLGEILCEDGWVSEADVKEALGQGGFLGQVLLDSGKISTVQLRAALRKQARAALQDLDQNPPVRYTFGSSDQLPTTGAALMAGEVICETLFVNDSTSMDGVFQMAKLEQNIQLSPVEWELLRQINGRRTTERVVELSGVPPSQAKEAIRVLLEQGCIEQSAITGLKFIKVRTLEATNVRQPPSTIKSNLFLKQLTGDSSVAYVASQLKMSMEEATLLLTSLFRDGWIEVVEGEEEFKKLLENY